MSRSNNDHSNKNCKAQRRSPWAADLEHLIPGGDKMSDIQLEVAALEMLRRNR